MVYFYLFVVYLMTFSTEIVYVLISRYKYVMRIIIQVEGILYMMPLPQTYKINSIGSLSKCSCSVVHKFNLFTHNHRSSTLYCIKKYLVASLIKNRFVLIS
jgi:hypothetical protein